MRFAPLRAVQTAFWGALLSQGQISTRRGCSGTAWVRKRPQCICPMELRPWMPTCPCCTGICICKRAAPHPKHPPQPCQDPVLPSVPPSPPTASPHPHPFILAPPYSPLSFGGGVSAHTVGQGDPRSGSPKMPNAPGAAWGALSLLSPLPPHCTSVSVPSPSFQPHPPALQPVPGGGPATPKQLQSGSNHRASLGSHSRALEGGKNSPGAGKERGGCRAHRIGPLRGQDCDPGPTFPPQKKATGQGGRQPAARLGTHTHKGKKKQLAFAERGDGFGPAAGQQFEESLLQRFFSLARRVAWKKEGVTEQKS